MVKSNSDIESESLIQYHMILNITSLFDFFSLSAQRFAVPFHITLDPLDGKFLADRDQPLARACTHLYYTYTCRGNSQSTDNKSVSIPVELRAGFT